MTQLTKEHFDEVLNKLATKEDLQPLATQTDLLATKTEVALVKEDVHTLSERLDGMEVKLDAHTSVLDTILGNSEHWKTEAAALHSANQRHERWIKQLADKIGIRLEE